MLDILCYFKRIYFNYTNIFLVVAPNGQHSERQASHSSEEERNQRV